MIGSDAKRSEAMRLSMMVLQILIAGLVLSLVGGAAHAQGQRQAWAGEPPAVARLLQEGDRAERSRQFAKAAARYCTAARFGSAEAQFRLGRLYQTGRGVRRDAAIGATLLRVAAQRGHVQARKSLGQARQPFVLPDCLDGGRSVLREGIPADLQPVIVAGDPGNVTGARRPHAQLVARLAPKFGVDPRFALAIARAESDFDPLARSPKNAQGLMQLIPETAERFGVRDAFDPEQNVRGGLAYLKWLLRRYDGDVILTAAAYNAGEGAVEQYGGVPPFDETREYVRRILSFYPYPRHVFPGDGAVALAPAQE